MVVIQNKFIIFIQYCDVYKEFFIMCLNSIENQKYTNYEVIIVNDGAKDTSILDKYVKHKKIYKILNFEKNNGPAFSKWKFIEYIQNNLDKYSVNDICIIVDGDDYLLDNALNMINHTYINTKCWITFGDTKSKCSFIKTHSNRCISDKNFENIRNRKFFSNHPRTFKLGLLKYINIDIFLYNNSWLIKGTDLTLLCDLFELCGSKRICYINHYLYYYRTHENNSFIKKNNETEKLKKDGIKYIFNRKKRKVLIEDIHIVMCCWKRYQNLELQFKMLNNQTVSKRIHWHLINNNFDEKDNLEDIVNECKKKYTNIKVSVSHYKNEYSCFQRHLYIKNNLLKNYFLDYVIIIDDDQLFKNNWVENMWNSRKPKIYTGWFCKKWINNYNYWNGSIIKFKDLITNTNKNIKYVDYVGPGGCIIDTTIFNDKSSFWEIPNDLPESVSIYNIDDLWLSFIAKYKLGYSLERSFLPEYKSINQQLKTDKMALFTSLIKEKQLLLNYLIKKYKGLPIPSEILSHPTYSTLAQKRLILRKNKKRFMGSKEKLLKKRRRQLMRF